MVLRKKNTVELKQKFLHLRLCNIVGALCHQLSLAKRGPRTALKVKQTFHYKAKLSVQYIPIIKII